MDINKVIILGHNGQQPLIRCPSELADGLEPHDHIQPWLTRARTMYSGDRRGRGCTRDVRQLGTWEGATPGTTQPARLRLIS